MMETKAVNAKKYVTYDDQIAATNLELNALGKLLAEHLAAITKIVHESFVTNGGCDSCHGRGWVVVWDTMDSMSGCYAEYGSCPNDKCTPESRSRSGVDSGLNSKYDTIKGTKCPVTAHPLHKIMCAPVLNDIQAMQRTRDSLKEKAKVKKGDVVVVIKGRKAPIDTVARVAFVHANGSALLKDEKVWQDRNANGTWVPLQNLSVIV